MNAAMVMTGQLGQARGFLEFATAGLDADQWHQRSAGSTIQSIAAIYAHAALAQDYLVNTVARDRPMLYVRDEWEAKTKVGIVGGMLSDAWSEAMPAADMDAFRDYHAAIAAEVDDYIGSLSDDDLDRTITFGPRGDMPLGAFLGDVVAAHIAHHAGEVAALTGILGGKGLPM